MVQFYIKCFAIGTKQSYFYRHFKEIYHRSRLILINGNLYLSAPYILSGYIINRISLTVYPIVKKPGKIHA